jgi:ubiquinone/menaquinone biosynthesis C-methylase UbiE
MKARKSSQVARREYNQIAEDFFKMNGHNVAQELAIYPTFLSMIGECPSANVVDLGCGSGYSTREIQRVCHPKTIEGIDVSERQIALAKRSSEGQNINYSVGDLTDFEMARKLKKRFNVATAAFLFNYASTKRDLYNMMKNANQLLDLQEVFIGIIPNPNVGKAYDNYGIRLEPIGGSNEEGSPYRVTLAGAGTSTSFTNYWWSAKAYAHAFEENGFSLGVFPCMPTKDAIKRLGRDFWKDYLERPSSLVFHATKREATK